MKVENWLYFRTVNNEDNDDGDTGTEFNLPTSMCVPASAISQIQPNSDTSIKVNFNNLILRDDVAGYGRISTSAGDDSVILNTTQGKTKEVMTALSELVSGQGTKGDGFTVVADDMTTNAANETVAARYFHPDITGCGTISAHKTKQGVGMHEYYEVVAPVGGTSDDTNDVVASLSIKLPAECIILEAGMTVISRANANAGLVALEIHNAAIADDAASGGTEILGADTVNLSIQGVTNAAGTKDVDNTSVPDADLDISSDCIFPNSIHTGVMDPIDRDTAVTHFQVTAKEDMSSVTGSARVGVYVRWFGSPAVALN